jgi:hypothetical protein
VRWSFGEGARFGQEGEEALAAGECLHDDALRHDESGLLVEQVLAVGVVQRACKQNVPDRLHLGSALAGR